MRTYAPAVTEAVLARDPRGAVARPRRRPPRGASPPGAAECGDHPGLARSADPGAASRRAASSGSTPTRPRRSRPSTPARTSSSSRRPRRARRSATRCRSSRRSPTTRRRGRCSSSRPRRSARTRSRSSRELSRAAGLSISAATYDGDTPAPDPVGDPRGRPGRRDEPGHAALGDPPPPHEVVPAVRAAPGHRHRRAAHVPRRLRQPRRERHPAAAPAVRPLRQPRRSSSAARRRSRTRPSWRRC